MTVVPDLKRVLSRKLLGEEKRSRGPARKGKIRASRAVEEKEQQKRYLHKNCGT